ncbi:translesion error-prone DNA polymerase V autoproteolytic subunit [Aureimonas psammosilenae]|nr:translesion error-prone DNA polymerase V autoproteolytic subunit [Aureimonas psammosilenae]
MFGFGLCAGFPSPADDFLDEAIDLGRLLVPNPPATFMWKVDGWSMKDAGIFHGDLLVVDRSLTPRHRDVVVATVYGERSLKRIHLDGPTPRLAFDNAELPAFDLPPLTDVEIWGVASFNVHWLREPAARRKR